MLLFLPGRAFRLAGAASLAPSACFDIFHPISLFHDSFQNIVAWNDQLELKEVFKGLARTRSQFSCSFTSPA
jgi:hypothetical protein